jgi:hypothetical protein
LTRRFDHDNATYPHLSRHRDTIAAEARQRNATQRNATQRNATQRNATQRNATQRNGAVNPVAPASFSPITPNRLCRKSQRTTSKPGCRLGRATFGPHGWTGQRCK